jgi:PIN domain nuclease of toxin-antitoxin system
MIPEINTLLKINLIPLLKNIKNYIKSKINKKCIKLSSIELKKVYKVDNSSKVLTQVSNYNNITL